MFLMEKNQNFTKGKNQKGTVMITKGVIMSWIMLILLY